MIYEDADASILNRLLVPGRNAPLQHYYAWQNALKFFVFGKKKMVKMTIEELSTTLQKDADYELNMQAENGTCFTVVADGRAQPSVLPCRGGVLDAELFRTIIGSQPMPSMFPCSATVNAFIEAIVTRMLQPTDVFGDKTEQEQLDIQLELALEINNLFKQPVEILREFEDAIRRFNNNDSKVFMTPRTMNQSLQITELGRVKLTSMWCYNFNSLSIKDSLHLLFQWETIYLFNSKIPAMYVRKIAPSQPSQPSQSSQSSQPLQAPQQPLAPFVAPAPPVPPVPRNFPDVTEQSMLQLLMTDKFVRGTVLRFDANTGIYARDQYTVGSGSSFFGEFPFVSTLVSLDFTRPNAIYMGRVNVNNLAHTNTMNMTGSATYNDNNKRTLAQSSMSTSMFPLDSDGANYVGGWKDGLFHGHGVLTFKHPNVGLMKYNGMWYEGHMRGEAVLSFGPLCRYEWKTKWDDDKLVSIEKWGRYDSSTYSIPLSHQENGRVFHMQIVGGFSNVYVAQSAVFTQDNDENTYLNRSPMMTHHIAVVYIVHPKTNTSMLYSGVKYAKDEFKIFQNVMKSVYPTEWELHKNCTMAYCPNMYTMHERQLLSDTTVMFYEHELSDEAENVLTRLMNEAVTTDINIGNDVDTNYDYNEFELVSVIGISLPTRTLDWFSAVTENMASKRQWPETKEWVEAMVREYDLSPNKHDRSVMEKVKITTKSPMRTTTAIDSSTLTLFPDNTRIPTTRRNEHYLFHGTSSTLSIASILCDRYHIPHSSSGSMMGRALYMSDHFGKADQYNSIDKFPRNYSIQDQTEELDRRLQTQNALLRLIGLFKGNDDANDASAYDSVLKELGTVDQRRPNQPHTLNIMLVFRTVMGVNLQLSAFDEFKSNRVSIQTGASSSTEVRFGVQTSQPFDNEFFQRDNLSDSDFNVINGATHNTAMESMERLLDRFDSVSIRSWSLNGSGNRMRFPEHLLYGKSAQNALPVAMIVYSRKLNTSKPYVMRSDGTNSIHGGGHNPNRELDDSRYTVQSLSSIDEFLS